MRDRRGPPRRCSADAIRSYGQRKARCPHPVTPMPFSHAALP